MTPVMVSIEEILENWSSCDDASAGDWDSLLTPGPLTCKGQTRLF